MLPSKKDIFHAALDQSGQPDGHAGVMFLVAFPGVAVGDFAQDAGAQGLVRLDFTLRGKEPLDTDDVGIRGVLGRKGIQIPVFIPWAAVVSIGEASTGNAIFFQYKEKADLQPAQETRPAPQSAKRTGLRLVKHEEN